MKAKGLIGIMIAVATVAVASAAGGATFDSGSTGANGALPPEPPDPAPPASYAEMRIDLATGMLSYHNGDGSLVRAAEVLRGGSGGFPTGVLNLTSVTIPTGKTVKFKRNAANTPVLLLAQTDVTIAGTINLDGQPGQFPGLVFPSAGAGGPGGFDGGEGGGKAIVAGGMGLGPGGGSSSDSCGGGGGGFGAPGRNAPPDCGTAGGPSYGNPQLIPLLGGSGGGGGAQPIGGPRGSGGGGGGGAILIAASGTLTLTGTISAAGGGAYSGGGAGGGVRLVATTLTGSGGRILVTGGNGFIGTLGPWGRGGFGRIRLEAFTNNLTLVEGMPPSLGSPGPLFPSNVPTITIVSVGGQTVPAGRTGSIFTPDVTLPGATTSPVRVVVTATNIPDGTAVVLRAKPMTGAATTVTTPALLGGTAQADLPMDLTQPNVLDAEATFQLGAALDSPIKYAGEDVTTATVTASLGPSTSLGTGSSQVRYYTASGREVPAEALVALGLAR